ncbi:NACHT domain-containing protein [Streptomyces sp. 8N706]|uniref:NACHT domain-containing protein n=1 Tax=Streptomyces sp. 8N706 TaxID=3457416 RepID=UPI003FD653AB
MDKQRVVEVWFSAGKAGTGYLVADDLILTAHHNVCADDPAHSIEIRPLGGTAWVTAERIWPAQEGGPARPPGADAALLRITDPTWRPPSGSAPVRWGRVVGQDRISCLAVGFPDAEQRARTRDTKEIRGHVETLTGIKSGLITVHVDQSAVPSAFDGGSGWSGSSGAALFCGPLLIGVLTTDRSGAYPANQLTAVPMAGLADRPGFEATLKDAGVDLIFKDIAPPPPPPARGAPWRRKAAEDLASQVEKQWQKEEQRRQVHHPFPLAVRFQPAETGLFDHWANIRQAPPGTDPGPLPLTGRLDQILDVYRSVPSRRLVVLGAAGSGKTVLTLRFVLDWLGDRAPGNPVPVIFGLGSWDPTTISLRDWMCGQLVRDYAGLAAPAPAAHGGNLAGALVDAGWILPVLDGFDEIASGLQCKALKALNHTTTALLLTSRSAEYAAAVKQTAVLTGAAVVELDALTPDDLADYLPRASRPGRDGGLHSTAWEPVLAKLRKPSPGPDAVNVATVLTTPLMVALARSVYSGAPGHDPAELLKTARSATPEDLRKHLLAAFTPTAYDHPPTDRGTGRRRRRHWDPDRAQHWLGYLAAHLDQLDTPNLAWWQLGTTMSRASRMLVVGSLAALAFGVTTGVGNLPVDLIGTSHGLKFALVRGLVVGLLHGLVAGLAFGLVYGFVSRGAAEPSRVRIQIFGGTRKVRARFVPRFMVGFGLGLPAALVLVLVDRCVVEPLGLGDGLDGGLVGALVFGPQVGLGAGLVLGLMAWLEVPIDIRSAVSPSDLLDINRRNVVFHLLVWALVFGLLAGVVNGLMAGPVYGLLAGLVFGLVAAFGCGLGYGLSLTAWGQWVALSRIWLPLTGRLPWALVAFLEDACERGVLRQAGAVYQFRHAQLQDHLAHAFQARRDQQPVGSR